MKILSLAKNPYTSLAINLAYGIGNCVLGFFAHSWWFITVGAYYAVLTVTRFSVLRVKQKAQGNWETEFFAKRITGILLLALSLCIIGVNILSALKDRGTSFHKIVMIALATYTFTKVTMAIVGMVKAKHSPSPVTQTLRNISLADACVSVYTMQRSMLVTFPGMEAEEIWLLNLLTGTAVWIVLLILGINLIGGKYTDMAKTHIAKSVDKIGKAITGSYRKIEAGVVSGYRKVEDKFVSAYLVKDGETVEEAKARRKNKTQK